eukprot:1323305-Prymnesium_polylepis.1
MRLERKKIDLCTFLELMNKLFGRDVLTAMIKDVRAKGKAHEAVEARTGAAVTLVNMSCQKRDPYKCGKCVCLAKKGHVCRTLCSRAPHTVLYLVSQLRREAFDRMDYGACMLCQPAASDTDDTGAV